MCACAMLEYIHWSVCDVHIATYITCLDSLFIPLVTIVTNPTSSIVEGLTLAGFLVEEETD